MVFRTIAALAIVAASFFATLQVLKYWESDSIKELLREPRYDAAKLPHLKPTQSLTFSNGQNRSALLSGWSVAESGGVWSDGRAAFIGFVVDGAPGLVSPKSLVVRASVFLTVTKRQRVEVWSANQRLAEYDLKEPSAELAIPLGGINVSNGTPVVLTFYLPDATSPTKAGISADRRDLALFIISLSLTP
jgi:hypothetical protein